MGSIPVPYVNVSIYGLQNDMLAGSPRHLALVHRAHNVSMCLIVLAICRLKLGERGKREKESGR